MSDETPRRRPWFRLAAGLAGCLVVLAAAAVVFAVVAVRNADQMAALGPGGPSSPIQIGQAAPDFELYTDDERLLALSDFRGQPVALNFWATWCLPCRFEIPAMTEAMERHADADLQILSINVAERPSLVLEFLAERDVGYEVLLDPYSRVADQYAVQGLPTTVWIDDAGIVRYVDTGALTADSIDEAVALLTSR